MIEQLKPFEVDFELISALLVLALAFTRFTGGFARVADQPVLPSMLERVGIIISVVAMVVICVSAWAMPIFAAEPIDIIYLTIEPTLIDPMPLSLSVAQAMHTGGHYALTAGAGVVALMNLKHLAMPGDTTHLRNFRAISGGK
ncbi:MAG: hypothetical protein AAGI92_12980 [Pseudomonadota bacterium]